MSFPISLPLLIVFLVPVWVLVSLCRNIRKAQATRLPYVLSPIHELEGLAWITDPILRWHFREYLLQEKGWPRWARFMIRDWHYEDKGRAHDEYGPVFLVVSPGGLVCYSIDPDTAMSVATRRKAFVKPPGRMKLLEPFGPNVVSTDGDLWRFHIRTTLPAVGEGVQRLAWDETRRQAEMLRRSWLSAGASEVRENMYQLSMNIACHVIFNQRVDWPRQQGGDTTSPPLPHGHKMSLLEALSKLVLQLPFIILLPVWFLRLLPIEAARTASQAYVEVDRYMDELLAAEKTILDQGPKKQEGRRDNLVTALLSSNDPLVGGNAPKVDGLPRFTMKDIKGNMFVFLLAGYETTANTLIYSCIVLSLYPEIQARAHEEVDAVYAQLKDADHDELSYPSDFQRFRYLAAFMYEMLRVFPISLAFTRELASDQRLPVPVAKGSTNFGEALLPRGSAVVANVTGSHFAAANWPSPHTIEPRRWLCNNPNAFDPRVNGSDDDEGEPASTIPSHRKGTFLSFGEGPRACLGRPLARVEFVAFFSTILRHNRVELDDGVDGVALERLIRCRGGGAPVSLNIPEAVSLRLVPRNNQN